MFDIVFVTAFQFLLVGMNVEYGCEGERAACAYLAFNGKFHRPSIRQGSCIWPIRGPVPPNLRVVEVSACENALKSPFRSVPGSARFRCPLTENFSLTRSSFKFLVYLLGRNEDVAFGREFYGVGGQIEQDLAEAKRGRRPVSGERRCGHGKSARFPFLRPLMPAMFFQVVQGRRRNRSARLPCSVCPPRFSKSPGYR